MLGRVLSTPHMYLLPSYASTFEENRIGKDMLLDLDKVSFL